MRVRFAGALCGAALLSVFAACSNMNGFGQPATSSNAPLASTVTSGYGVVQSIDTVNAADASGVGLGTLAGAVAGGLIGNQVGGGRGNTAATVAGAAGGAYAGHQVEQNMKRGQGNAFRITLRMDDGSMQSVVQAFQPSARVGDRVHVVNGTIS